MNRKIYYLDCYAAGVKEKNIGFIKIDEDKLFIMLRGIGVRGGMECSVYLRKEDGEKVFAVKILTQNGYGQAECSWPEGISYAQCAAVEIPLYSERYGRCVIRETEKKQQPVKKTETTKTKTASYREREAVVLHQEIESLPDILPDIGKDKWTQLCRVFPQVHIYPEAETIVIKPKDIVILTKEYHELAGNSFLLHAYYNYRQLLLLRYQKKEAEYYLGVPGVFYEREKRIAIMFGFEGFENGESRLAEEERRKIYTGCFGYYMKRVMI